MYPRPSFFSFFFYLTSAFASWRTADIPLRSFFRHPLCTCLKGNYRWDSAKAGEDNLRADYGPSNEGYVSLAWLPGQDSSSLVLLAGTSFKFLKMVDSRRGGGVGGGGDG